MNRRSGRNRDVKEVVAKTQAVHGANLELSEREDAETEWQPGVEDIDPTTMNEEPAASAHSGHGKESATITAQIVKEKGKGKPGAKEVERRWSCPKVEPKESILHTDVDWTTRFKTSRELLVDFPTSRDQRFLSFFSEEQIEENVTLMTAQGKPRKEEEDHQASVTLLKEEKEKRREVEAEVEQLREKANDLQRGLVAEQNEKVQLRATIQDGRMIQRELKGSLEEYVAVDEGTSVQHYIKTEEFKAALVELFPEERIPKPKLVKRSPLEIMKDLVVAEDADMDPSAIAPPPLEGDMAEVHEDCIVCTRKHALPLCKAVGSVKYIDSGDAAV
ncbi:hypothetical protein Dimus_003363 [Dionaea muscipula]